MLLVINLMQCIFRNLEYQFVVSAFKIRYCLCLFRWALKHCKFRQGFLLKIDAAQLLNYKAISEVWKNRKERLSCSRAERNQSAIILMLPIYHLDKYFFSIIYNFPLYNVIIYLGEIRAISKFVIQIQNIKIHNLRIKINKKLAF